MYISLVWRCGQWIHHSLEHYRNLRPQYEQIKHYCDNTTTTYSGHLLKRNCQDTSTSYVQSVTDLNISINSDSFFQQRLCTGSLHQHMCYRSSQSCMVFFYHCLFLDMLRTTVFDQDKLVGIPLL